MRVFKFRYYLVDKSKWNICYGGNPYNSKFKYGNQSHDTFIEKPKQFMAFSHDVVLTGKGFYCEAAAGSTQGS